MKVCLLQGGNSSERDISIKSSEAIAGAIIELGYDIDTVDPKDYSNIEDLIIKIKSINPDIVFIGLHGGDGENGVLQAVLKASGIKFTGSSYSASAIAIDKYISASIAKIHDISVPKQHLLNSIPKDMKQLLEYIDFPIVVKPNTAGSSVGIHIVDDYDDLITAMEDAFRYDKNIILQEFIKGRELTVTILDNKVLPVVEIVPKSGFYDYKNKYTKGNTEYLCPANLSVSETRILQMYAEKIFKTTGCEIYGRIDFRYDGKKFYFLETNTLPGMTELSLSPMAAKETGIDFKELISQIINLSLKKAE